MKRRRGQKCGGTSTFRAFRWIRPAGVQAVLAEVHYSTQRVFWTDVVRVPTPCVDYVAGPVVWLGDVVDYVPCR